MEWKFSFTFDSEEDKEIIELIQGIPKSKRGLMVREVFRNHMDAIKEVNSADCLVCSGIGHTEQGMCYYCNGVQYS